MLCSRLPRVRFAELPTPLEEARSLCWGGQKAARLLDRVREGGLTSKQTVVYVNTGGSPALFALNAELLANRSATAPPA